jgi:ferredoxin--NADP+ reductase
MFKIIDRSSLVPNLHLLVVEAPEVVESIQPGQFVIIHAGEGSERIPLTAADWNREQGTLSIVFMEVGTSTGKLAQMKAGEELNTVVGPLGVPLEVRNYGTVVCIGGCFGMGSIYPVVRALKESGNKVVTMLEGRSENLLYWQDKLSVYSDKIIRLTRDGSCGYKGHVKKGSEILHEMNIKPDRVIANGCTTLSYLAVKEYEHYNVPVMVTLNTIMIDGTGMCGVCRCTVNGQMKFACVDGPSFDGRFVDWDELASRRKQYISEEAFLVHHSGCGGI